MLQVKQIPEKTGYYLAGFADAKGYFRLSLRESEQNNSLPWQVLLHFEVVHSDKVMLALFKRHLKCGTLCSADDVWHYEVSNFNALKENVVPFFRRFNFLSAEKKGQFSKFRQIMSLLQDEPLTQNALQEILKLGSQLDLRATEDEIVKKILRDYTPSTVNNG